MGVTIHKWNIPEHSRWNFICHQYRHYCFSDLWLPAYAPQCDMHWKKTMNTEQHAYRHKVVLSLTIYMYRTHISESRPQWIQLVPFQCSLVREFLSMKIKSISHIHTFHSVDSAKGKMVYHRTAVDLEIPRKNTTTMIHSVAAQSE